MTDMELLKLSSELKRDADKIVTSLKLISVANKYCECHQIGSSVMDLMVDEDIDFTCYHEGEVDLNKCFMFAQELMATDTVENIKLKNYLHKGPYYQFKVYIDPYKFNNRYWQIAFSFQKKTERLVDTEIKIIDSVKEKLNPENKLTILRLKLESRKQKIKVPGFFIYESVLDHGVSSFDDLLRHLHI